MKTLVRLAVGAVLGTTAPVPLWAQTLSFTDPAWTTRGDSIRVEQFDGRTVLSMRNGFAWRRDLKFGDGTIDVDVMTTTARSFVYLLFRMQSDSTYEDFYLRPHKSNAPDALQYAPVYQGSSAWQLYHGENGTAAANIPPGKWNHLRIVLKGRQAAFFLNDTITPAMVVARLGHAPRAGYLALRTFLPAGVAVSDPVARYANLRLRPDHVPFAFPPKPAATFAPGTVQAWEVGAPFPAPDSLHTVVPAASVGSMRRVEALSSGLVEWHRLVPLGPGMRNVGVVARLRVDADTAGIYRMELGFSDRVTAFVNGTPLFFGDDSYDYVNRRDGLIGFSQATLFLPLRQGANVLDFVVTDGFGGWGIMGRFPSTRGLRLSP